jgi:CubicO group peptidase (beta-lactamase class C family)
VVAVTLACLASFSISSAFAHPPAQPSDAATHRRHIEQGLVPPVLVSGEPVSGQPLAAHMSELGVPGVSIAVIRAGRVEWADGFGVVRLGGPKVTDSTLFQAASISKPITALAVLHLVEAGRLDLDEDVNTYLKSWQVPASSFTERHKVSLRGLLTHTAGMTVWGFPGYTVGALLPGPLQILDGLPPANTAPIRVEVEPGTRERYSGGGYVVVRQLLMDVTGLPFETLMQQTVLGPLGMSRSTFAQPLPAAEQPHAAAAYTNAGEPVAGGAHVYPEQAPDGLWTTPSDIARYIIAVQQALQGSASRGISREMARAMLTRQPGTQDQGLGPQLGGGAEHPYFMHGGSNVGFRCRFVAYEDGDGVVVMSNGDNGGQLVDAILRTIAREYGWPDLQPPLRTIARVNPALFSRYVGIYRLNPTQLMTVSIEEGQLYSQITDQPRRALYPMSDREFFMREMDERITFTVDAQGQATGLTQYHFGVEDVSPRLAAP